MKKLTKLKFKHYFFFFLIIFLPFGIFIFSLFIKIESSFKTHLIVDSYKPIFIIESKDIYKIQKNQNVSIKINNKFYYGIVKSINYDNHKKLYKAKISNLNIKLVPGSILEAKIIYDNQKLYKKILE